VIRVIKDGVVVLSSTANMTLGGIGQVVGIAIRSIVDRVLKAF
jgi:hypothetical protein